MMLIHQRDPLSKDCDNKFCIPFMDMIQDALKGTLLQFDSNSNQVNFFNWQFFVGALLSNIIGNLASLRSIWVS